MLLTGTCLPATHFNEALQVVLAKSMQPASADLAMLRRPYKFEYVGAYTWVSASVLMMDWLYDHGEV